ncbi:MAG: 50S ribosomal protein L21 [Candidatus Magasanikbacteria bacterium]|jgi:large subunit ribosomal protein L21|nr:50S ribosomal protein L21 [Candidatus Magasanikbacteria bacterium]
MFAVIETGGKQYLVKSGQKLSIEKIDAEPGTDITFDKVLLVADEEGKNVKIGAPYIDGVTITAKVDEQMRERKIRVVKYKRKIRYKRVHGHRQHKSIITLGAIA